MSKPIGLEEATLTRTRTGWTAISPMSLEITA
ncbi:hypothetical protein EC912_103173 [Luteibacter rhizovicinus]|uniref:Uncharacterized protein n=1 Tax=Luteibacter rhizovicinus TaxID=242606 RepID=A0A4R3YSK5_9GAMM|nr:hypothetical protein EC912_103173 [Luteibacter rhizovicinus]